MPPKQKRGEKRPMAENKVVTRLAKRLAERQGVVPAAAPLPAPPVPIAAAAAVIAPDNAPQEDRITHIPEDAALKIFAFVNREDLFRMSFVSRCYYNLFKDPTRHVALRTIRFKVEKLIIRAKENRFQFQICVGDHSYPYKDITAYEYKCNMVAIGEWEESKVVRKDKITMGWDDECVKPHGQSIAFPKVFVCALSFLLRNHSPSKVLVKALNIKTSHLNTLSKVLHSHKIEELAFRSIYSVRVPAKLRAQFDTKFHDLASKVTSLSLGGWCDNSFYSIVNADFYTRVNKDDSVLVRLRSDARLYVPAGDSSMTHLLRRFKKLDVPHACPSAASMPSLLLDLINNTESVNWCIHPDRLLQMQDITPHFDKNIFEVTPFSRNTAYSGYRITNKRTQAFITYEMFQYSTIRGRVFIATNNHNMIYF